MSQISYVDTNSRGSNSVILPADINSSIESSYTWTNLIQGNYQFSVVAFTSKGQGEAASLILVIIRTHSSKLHSKVEHYKEYMQLVANHYQSYIVTR